MGVKYDTIALSEEVRQRSWKAVNVLRTLAIGAAR